MKIVIINPILYTCETSYIKKVKSIKDSMIYNLCLEFKNQGHEPVLIAAKDYEPYPSEKYDFDVIFLKTKFKKIFKPNCFPWLCGLKKIISEINPDYIISGEVFSINSLIVSTYFKKKTIIWHELAKHNNLLKKIPSIIWYNFIAKLFFHNTRIVARSENARIFISNYCNNVSDDFIDHGVDINKFLFSREKDKQFVVVSQLIKRKHIDGIIEAFNDFYNDNSDFKLIIIGSGEEEEPLKEMTKRIGLNSAVLFLGQKTHEEIIPILSKSYALLINTEKDNSMLSIVESIACGTPVLTTDVPYNCFYIKKFNLGLVVKYFNSNSLYLIKKNNLLYVDNCDNYRNYISNSYHVNQFINEFKNLE